MKNKNQNQNQNQNVNQNTTEQPPRLALPLMKSMDDAYELCRLEQDDFYMFAYMFQCWISRASRHVAVEYAEKKDARTRSLQSGQVSRAFAEIIRDALCTDAGSDEALPRPLSYLTSSSSEVGPDRPAGRSDDSEKRMDNVPLEFTHLDETKVQTFFQHFLRFIGFDDPIAGLCRPALFAFATEVGLKPETVIEPPFTMHPQFGTPRLALIYLCDWLDATLHLQTHAMWHEQPVMFNPDPEQRALASVAYLQNHFAGADPKTRAKMEPQIDYAAEHYPNSPKLRAASVALTNDTPRVWTYQDVDRAVITLWPLVKRHNWTYADLLKVIRPYVKRPKFYPCHREQTFATHCNLLGLRKPGKGTSAEGDPEAADIARRLLGLNK